MNPHSKALDSMFDDMDGMEQKKMFGEKPDGDEGNGFSITISVSPQGEVGQDDKDKEMNKGGVACMHEGGTVPKPEEEADIFDAHGQPDPLYKKGEMGMAKGGMIEPKSEPIPMRGETDDLSLPPFLRKKKKSI